MKIYNAVIDYIKLIMALTKFKISFFVTFSATLGYILAAGRIDGGIILPLCGVLMLSCGSSALNMWQERKFDSLMRRTKNRPIQSGKITATRALLMSLAMIGEGISILLMNENMTAVFLGALAVVWYNLFYTPLKRKTAFAVVPGALIGAIPPAIGWVSGGGSLFEPQSLALALFFFIWQVPHFWFLALIYDQDYKDAGFPTLTQIFSKRQLTRISYIWVSAMGASCLFINYFSPMNHAITLILLLIIGIFTVWRIKAILGDNAMSKNFRFAFYQINFYVLVSAFFLAADKLFFFLRF